MLEASDGFLATKLGGLAINVNAWRSTYACCLYVDSIRRIYQHMDISLADISTYGYIIIIILSVIYGL